MIQQAFIAVTLYNRFEPLEGNILGLGCDWKPVDCRLAATIPALIGDVLVTLDTHSGVVRFFEGDATLA